MRVVEIMTKKIDDMRMHSLTITHKHLSYCVALLIMGYLFTFIAGYYWGKKTTTENFIEQSGQDALADKVYSSMCSLYDVIEKENDADAPENGDAQEAAVPVAEVVNKAQESRYYAKLIGFGSKNSATAYVQRLAQRGIIVNIVERQSKSARGKTQIWYQVVTQPLPKDELTCIVNKLTAKDHLTDVTIIELSSESNERSNS